MKDYECHVYITSIKANKSGGTLIEWALSYDMQDPPPYRFTIQLGSTESNASSDWQTVGHTSDSFFFIDPTPRHDTIASDPVYRIILNTQCGEYIGAPLSSSRYMNNRQWKLASEIIRKELLRHSSFASKEGYLLFRKRFGLKCAQCTDKYTGEILKPDCISCYGTGISGGYHPPMPAQFADMDLIQKRFYISPSGDQSGLGTVISPTTKARFVGYPSIRSYDVWIDKNSDDRYYIHTVADAARVGNSVVVQIAELRLAHPNDIIHKFNLEIDE